MFYYLLFSLFSSAFQPENKNYKLLLTPQHAIWKDSSDMNFRLDLVNTSTSSTQVFDQVFDNVYTYQSTPLDNLFFIVQKKQNNVYEDYRDLPFVDQLLPDPWNSDMMIDSIKKIRSPYIQLLPNDTVSLVYSFSYGRTFSKGFYRIRARFHYGFTGMGNFVDSDWKYIEITNDIKGPRAQTIWETPKTLFWEKVVIKNQ